MFDLALALLRAHSGRFARLFALVVLPVALPAAVVAYVTGQGDLVIVTLPILFVPLQAPGTVLAGRLLFSDTVRIRDVFLELLRSAVPLFAAWFWQGAALVGGLMCFFVGALFSMPATAYVTEAALLERVGTVKCLQRSLRLAGSNPGNSIVVAVGWVFLTVWSAIVAEMAGQALVGFVFQLGAPFGSLWNGDVTPYLIFGIVAAQPLVGVYRLLLYVDARTRVEGWDLQVGLRAVGLGAS